LICEAQFKTLEAEKEAAAKEQARKERLIFGIDFQGDPEVLDEAPSEKALTPAERLKRDRKARMEHGGGSHKSFDGSATERKYEPLPVYTKKPRPVRPLVQDGKMDVVFKEEKLGIIVDDTKWDGEPKIVITQVHEGKAGWLAGAKEKWAVVAVNGESIEDLGLTTHTEVQKYVASVPVRPITMTLQSPPRPPTERELEERAEAEAAAAALEQERLRLEAEAKAKADEEEQRRHAAEEAALQRYHAATPLKEQLSPRSLKKEVSTEASPQNVHPVEWLQIAVFGPE